MNGTVNYLGKYKQINAKLKKRFLKKPNLAEGSAEFDSISKHLETEEQAFHYAAMFAKAQSKCESAIGNSAAEAGALMRAARLYLQAEEELGRTLSVSLHENLELAIASFVQAAGVYEQCGQPLLAVNAYLQLAEALMLHAKYAEAAVHLHRATDLVPTHTLLMLQLLGRLATCRLHLGDPHAALLVHTRMQEITQRSGGSADGSQLLPCYRESMRRCEVSRVLLLCLLARPPDRLEPEHAETMARYAWSAPDEETPPAFVSEELLLGLQSLVCACQAGDAAAVEEVHEHLFPLLTDEQNYLLHSLADQLRAPPLSATELGESLSGRRRVASPGQDDPEQLAAGAGNL